MNYAYTSYFNNKMTPTEFKKVELIKETINKSNARNASDNWRKHTPAYGWIKMNYPTTICPPISQKYIMRQKHMEEKENEKIKRKHSQDLKAKEPGKIESPYCAHNQWRLNPEKVNDDVLKEIDDIIPIDHTKKFMTNYKTSDMDFMKNMFDEYDKLKKSVLLDKHLPMNLNYVKDIWSKRYNFELKNKIAYVKLNTDDFEKKKILVDVHYFYEKKYSTMYPKINCLGPESDINYTKKLKKIGDISFEEEEGEVELVKNLKRLSPDHFTEEWIKENLNGNVEILRLDNCYWLSKDLVSKIGKIDGNLKELSLKNLDVDNFILENILKYTMNLEILDLTNCDQLSAGIGKIIKDNCPKLNTLILHGVNKIDDFTLEEIAQLQNLRELDLGLCKLITDVGLKSLAKGKPNTLGKIVITCLIKVTNSGLKELIANNVGSLIHITINMMPQRNVNGSEFLDLISKCKNLNYLDISGMPNVQGDYLDQICLNANEFLKYINVSGLTQIADSHIQGCLAYSKSIEVIRASNCPLLTNTILDIINPMNRDIADTENKLKLLEINRSPLINDNKIQEVFTNCAPNLMISRSTNQVWNMKNIGLRIPLFNKNYVKKSKKGKKGAAKSKKNDDKNPVNQLKKLLEESKPKRVIDLFSVKKGKKGKKSKKK